MLLEVPLLKRVESEVCLLPLYIIFNSQIANVHWTDLIVCVCARARARLFVQTEVTPLYSLVLYSCDRVLATIRLRILSFGKLAKDDDALITSALNCACLISKLVLCSAGFCFNS